MMRSLIASAASGLVLVLSAGLNPLQAQGSQTEQQLVSQVASENLMEVRLAQAAQRRVANPSVKQFAQRMIIDHTSMQKQWIEVAKKRGLDFKAEMSDRHRQQAQQLGSVPPAEFERAYMSLMVQNHQENVSNFQIQRNAGHSTEVRQLIDVALPTLQEHLRTAQQINAQLGGVAGNTGGGIDTTRVPTQPGQTPTTPPVVGQTPPTQAGQAANVRADSLFIGEVNTSNDIELRLARLAESKASADVVKRFAQKMATDHNWMQREWANVSARTGARISATTDPQMQGQISRLERLSGSDFDRAYMTAMVQNHQQTVNAFDTRGRSTQSTEVRQLVARSLPYLQEHLTLARQVAGQVGSDTTVATIAGNTNRGKSADISKDRKFVRDIDADHNLEIRLGELAEKRGRDESVKQFGRRMVDDHTRLKEHWTAMITNSGTKFKSGMGPRHRSKLDRLAKLSGREFDREYMTLVAQNHQDYLNYFRKEGRAAKSAAVRELVNRDIPMLEQHIQQAKQIGVRVGADTVTTRVGRISARER